MGGHEQHVLVQPSQAADVVELVCILDLDPGLGVTQVGSLRFQMYTIMSMPPKAKCSLSSDQARQTIFG